MRIQGVGSRLRRALEERIRGWWSGGKGGGGRLFSLFSWPFEVVFTLGVGLRNRAYDEGILKVHRGPIPVVSVGNLTVGGTGKTPVSAWIVGILTEMGARPALVVRGYGRDEILLHRRWNPGIPVVADPDRVEGVRRAAREGADVAVLDDGFQHRRLDRDLDLVLLAPRQSGRPRLLPRGPYREPLDSLARADLALVVEKGSGAEDLASIEDRLRSRFGDDGPPTVRLRMRATGWRDLRGEPTPAPSGPLLAVAGIADPRSFVRLLWEEDAGSVELMAYPDHHPYGEEEAREIGARAGSRTVVTTEKDAVKLQHFTEHLGDVRVLTLSVEPEEGAGMLRRALAEVIGTARNRGGLPPVGTRRNEGEE